MLGKVKARHFVALQGSTQKIVLGDEQSVSMRVERVVEHPRAQRSGAPAGERVPFSVDLTALEPTQLLDGPCTIELPELGHVPNIWMTRVVSDAQTEYGSFQIVFA